MAVESGGLPVRDPAERSRGCASGRPSLTDTGVSVVPRLHSLRKETVKVGLSGGWVSTPGRAGRAPGLQRWAQTYEGMFAMEQGLFWGDIHAHTYCGRVFGSPEDAIDIAKTHLDFCCTAEHGIGQPFNEALFPEYWRRSRAVLNQSNRPGAFVTLVGYEWGLPGYGDMNVYFPDNGPEDVVVPRSFAELLEYVEAQGAILVPHHTA